MVLADEFTITTKNGPVTLPAGFNVNRPAGVQPAEMIRINTDIKGDLCSPTPSRLGVLGGDACGFPNGRRLTDDIVAALKTVYDPEIPADIYELGSIYKIGMDGDRNVAIVMTLTAPGCPVAGEMPQWVENAVASVTGVGQVKVTLTFDPPWDKDRMSDEAKLTLNMF